MTRRTISNGIVRLFAVGAAFVPAVLSAQVKVADVLAYKPSQTEVSIDIPAAAEIATCKLDVERAGGVSGWALYGPNGQLLRRFLDTNADTKVDEFRYYLHGIEVFRDLDTNGDNEIDQSRWLNTAGTRWGVDLNKDHRIDAWRMISAEEATREAITALVKRDEQRLAAVMITPEDITQLGITGEAAKAKLERLQQNAATFRAVVANTKVITARTQWTRFDCSMLVPSLIPAEAGKTTKDLLTYQNVMAIVDNAGESAFLNVGEMVLVGQAWKLTQVPRPLDNGAVDADSATLLQPVIAGLNAGDGLSPRMKDLIDQLKKLDDGAPGSAATTGLNAVAIKELFAKYNVSRAALLLELAKEATTEDEKMMWMRQRVELVATATQTEAYPGGIEELRRMEQQLRQPGGSQDLLAFTALQRLAVEHHLALEKAAQEDRPKLQDSLQNALVEFIREFVRSPEAGEAVFELARLQEFNGEKTKALTWYQQLVTNYPQSGKADRGKGALRRLNLKGTELKLTGQVFGANGRTLDLSAYKGRVLAVQFWATWCQPCTQDLPQIQELHKTYQKNGFEVIGVNLDTPEASIQEYITNQKVTWPNLHEPGGLDSRLAVEFGIVTLPTVFLVNKRGEVVNEAATVQDLKDKVPELLKQ